jgi:hypothetical protein
VGRAAWTRVHDNFLEGVHVLRYARLLGTLIGGG